MLRHLDTMAPTCVRVMGKLNDFRGCGIFVSGFVYCGASEVSHYL